MKIFANNFAIQFRVAESQPHFRFQRSTWEEAAQALRQPPLLEGQVHYVAASADGAFTPDLSALLSLHTDPGVNARYAELALVFGDAAALADYLAAYTALFKPVAAAGGLVLHPERGLLMILRDGKWDLPKGKVEKGEAIPDAAWREVAEETGLQHHVRGALATQTFHIFPRGDKWRLKTTDWYWMVSETPEQLQPQTAEGITELRWFDHKTLMAEVPRTYPQIMALVRLSLTRMHA